MLRLNVFFLLILFMLCTPTQGSAQTQKLGEKANAAQLHDVLQAVYASNPSLLVARSELEVTKELYPQAIAGWRPSVNAEAGIYTTDVESSNFGGGNGATTKEYTLSVDQPIYRGGRTFAERDRAQEKIKAQQKNLITAEQNILLDTVSAYMNLARDRKLLELRKQYELTLKKERYAAWEQRKIGNVTDTDVNQAEARLSAAASKTAQAQTDKDISAAEYEQITGFIPPEQMNFPRRHFGFPLTLPEITAMAEENNPEMGNIQHEREASLHEINVRRRELFPQISAYATHNKQYDPQPGIVSESQTQTVGLRATLALYQGGATRSRIREAEKISEQRAHEIDETRRRIRQQVTSDWKSYLSAKTQTEYLDVEINAAQIALRGVREEARLGQRTLLDILDAEQELIDARMALIKAQRNEVVAQYGLAVTLGMMGKALGIAKER